MTNPSPLLEPVWLDEHRAVVQAKRGWFIANKHDTYLGEALLTYGEALDIEQQFLLTLIRPGDRVIEVGANIGVHTVGMCKAAGEVIAIEPQPSVFRTLCANLALNNIHNVKAHNVGCGSVSGTLAFTPYDTTTTHNSGGTPLSDGPGVQVPIVTLDALVGEVDSLKLVKIDVETMELDVLKGAAGLLRKHRPLLYVENEMQSHCEALVDWLHEHEYGMFWHTPPLYNGKNVRGAPNGYHHADRTLVSYNMLCMPYEYPEMIDGPLKLVTDPYHNNIGYIAVEK